MSGVSGKFPRRTYKTVPELELEENAHLRFSDINYLLEIDERVHMSTEGSKIAEYFSGKSIFITGGTGFLGKLLVEKLLRSCKGLETIYLLIRTKKEKSWESRIEEVLSDEIFSELAKMQPNFKRKVVGIGGDAGLPELGISATDRRILQEKVNIIFHAAATVRFDEKLSLATAINLRGTMEVLTLAKQCKNLCSMVHVSTAFSNCPQQIIEEKFYDPPYTLEELMSIVEKNDDEFIEKNLTKILKGWPNTYSFTKAMAEYAVRSTGDSLPICVYRPGIVISTYKEPLKNWINNLYGPMGSIVGAGIGILRTLYTDSEKVTDLVPGDFVVNGMVAAAYQEKNTKKDVGKIEIYNYVSCAENPITWGDFRDITVHYGLQFPTIHAVWYYMNLLIKNYYLFYLASLFLHFLPAAIIDMYLRITGEKPKFVKLYTKIHKIYDSLSHFAIREWEFHNDNTQELWKSLSEIDQKVFPFSLKKEYFDWNRYSSMLGAGARIYLARDPISTLPNAIKKYKRLYYIHRIVQGIVILLGITLLYNLSLWIFNSILS